MDLRVFEVWRRIRSSFWFLPSLMVLSTIALAAGCLWMDHAFAMAGAQPLAWLGVAGADSARGLLSTIAGSMITVAGVTFSVVIVALSMASSQYGPRLLARFMEDTGNQVVLGTFISVFAYCLVILLNLPSSDNPWAMPQLSIWVGAAMAFVAVGVLIFFFHHISTSIQAGGLIQEAGKALDVCMAEEFRAAAKAAGNQWPAPGFSEANGKVTADRDGYVSSFDIAEIAELARRHSIRVMIRVRSGDFVLDHSELAWVSPADGLTEAVGRDLRSRFAIVAMREEGDDLSLAFDRLTEIAVRGLSPGINDPYTAIAAWNQTTVALDRFLTQLPSTQVAADASDTPRVFWRLFSAESLLRRTLDPLRTYGRLDVRVLIALADGLARLGRNGRADYADLLAEELETLQKTAESSLELAADLESFNRARLRALDHISGQEAP